jgi:hypothetical protein
MKKEKFKMKKGCRDAGGNYCLLPFAFFILER